MPGSCWLCITVSSTSSPFCQGWYHCGRVLRQRHSGRLSAQGGGHPVSCSQHPCAGDPPLGGISSDSTGSAVHSGDPQCSRGLSLPSSPAPQLRVVSQHGRISIFDVSVAGDDRPICHLRQSPLLHLFLALPRPSFGGDGHALPVLGRSPGVRVSAVVHSSPGVGEASGVSPDPPRTHRPLLASASVVRGPPPVVGGSSSDSFCTPRPPPSSLGLVDATWVSTGWPFMPGDCPAIHQWSKKWQMPFNLDKCKIMHIGHKNKNEKYELLGKEIESVQQEKDLGVVITNDLKSSNQCIEAVKKAQKLLGYIKRQFRTRNKETILTLYNALVRPHLEYAVQFWSPSLRKDIERLEAVQARATKLIPSIRHLGYVRRLERLNLYSLEKRRLRGQLIETFKMLKGVNNIDYRHLFTFSNNRTRSNGWKLELKRFNTSQCGNFFTYKIAPIWNRLPAEAVNSASVEQFKIELDKVIDTLI